MVDNLQNNMIESKKEWSIWAIICFIISLLILIVSYILGFEVFCLGGFTSVIINIIGSNIAKKQNKEGARLSMLGIILALLAIPASIIMGGMRGN